MAPRHILLLLWVAHAEAANNTTSAFAANDTTTFAPTTTPVPTSSRHHPEACQERCYPEEGQNYDEDCCALRDRMSCLGNYTLIQLGYVCASGDGWKAHAYECVPCEGPACDNGPGDDVGPGECDDHGMWWLWVIFLPMFVMIISIVCGICCCLHFQARRHAWEDQFADRPIMLTHRPCVEMRHVPVAEAFVAQEGAVVGEARPGDAASVPTAAAVEYPLPPLPPAYQAPPR